MYGHHINHSANYMNAKSRPYGHVPFRQQPFEMNGYPQWSWNTLQGQIPYSNYANESAYYPYVPPGYNGDSYAPTPYSGDPYLQQTQAKNNQSSSFYNNPLHTWDEPVQTAKHHQPINTNAPYMNPYPKQSFIQQQPTGMKSIMNSFKSQDGSLDINKMVDTAGQMMNAVNQVSGLVKGFGGFFKV